MEKDIPAKMDDARTFLARKILNVNGIFFLDRFNKNGSFYFFTRLFLSFFSVNQMVPQKPAQQTLKYISML